MSGDAANSHTAQTLPSDVAAANKARKSVTPQPAARENAKAQPPQQNGDSKDEIAQNESEAETVILPSPKERDVERKAKRSIKHEPSDDEAIVSSSEEASHSLRLGHKIKRKGVNAFESGYNNHIHSSGKSSQRTSPSNLGPSRVGSPFESQQSPGSHAPHSPPLATPSRARSSSIIESRKRKFREDNSSRSLEPPRQRHKADSVAKSVPPRKSELGSPGTPDVRGHKRSVSAQSVPQKANHKRRDSSGQQAQDSRDWKSESESEDSEFSPPRRGSHEGRARPKALQTHQARTKRAGRRLLHSPPIPSKQKTKVDKFGSTKTALAAEKGDLAAVQSALKASPEELNYPDFNWNSPLQKASLNGHATVVQYLIDQKCNTDCFNKSDKDTPLIDAVENLHLDVVKLLLWKAKVNPKWKCTRLQTALQVHLDPENRNKDDDDWQAIREELERAEREWEGNEAQEPDWPPPEFKKDKGKGNNIAHQDTLFYYSYNSKTMLHKIKQGDTAAVNELLSSNVTPDLACLVAAASGGHESLLNVMLASASASGVDCDPDPLKHDETPMLAAIGSGCVKVIELLLKQDNFDPTRRTRDGKSYAEVAKARRGPGWQKEVEILTDAMKNWNPSRRRAPKIEQHSPTRDTIRLRSKEVHHEIRANSVFSSKPRKSLVRRKDSRHSRQSESRASDEEDDEDWEVSRNPSSRPSSNNRLHHDRDIGHARHSPDVERPIKIRKIDYSPHTTEHENSDREKVERKKAERERAMREREERERAEWERAEREKALREREEKERAEREKADREKAEREKAEREKVERERAEQQKAERERLKREQAEREKAEREAADEKRRIEEAQKRKELERQQREAAERQRQKEEAERERKRLEQEKEEAARRAQEERERQEELRRQEQARREEEERQRQEQARREAEERARLEQELREKAERERRERLERLPEALKYACSAGPSRPLNFAHLGAEPGIKMTFFPVHLFRLGAIDQNCDESRREERWMLSFQAVGILGLHEMDMPEYPDWDRREVTEFQRQRFLKQYDVSILSQGRFRLVSEVAVEARRETEQKFLQMPLWFIKFDDFTAAVAKDKRLSSVEIETSEAIKVTPPGPRKSWGERAREKATVSV